MKNGVIAITYYGDTNPSKHAIDKETEDYVYYTNGWCGTKHRYNKHNNKFQALSLHNTWEPYNENVGIIQVDLCK